MIGIRKTVAIGASIAAMAIAAAAQAQASGDTESADDESEIIVTANKREQSINDVGLTIQAATAESLSNRGITNVSDLTKLVPGFTATQSTFATPIYTLRGIGLYDATVGASPAVAIYTDQISRNFPMMSDGLELDIERVEVLKGPQGTLFGQSSTGGAINYIVGKPTDTLESGGTASFERFNRIDVSGYISGPLSDSLRARLAVRGISGGAWQYSGTRPDDKNGATRKPHGPLTAWRLRRFYAFLAVVFALGIAPLALGMSAPWQTFGLGLIFPGAGFLFAGGLGVVFATLTVAVFAVVMFLWWARGPILAPPAVILVSALLAAAWIGEGGGVAWLGYAIPVAVAGLHLHLALRRRTKFAEQQAKGVEINSLLAKAEPILVDAPTGAAGEMPESQVAEFRRMLDLALQPVDSWTGFTMDDTWQDGALRYQIATMSWNLAFGQYTQLPAFHGYLNRAQENLIRKHIDRKTWNYWFWESLWGNFKYEKNPVATDNIMLSGFLGVSLGLFETASGTSPFAAPGALTYRWDEKTAFPYSHETLLHEVVKNYKRYDLGWFPCEPRWIYSMCNLVGRTGLALHDARHGTNLIGQVGDRFEKTMEEEMMMADGRIKVCTSSPFGFQVPSLSGLFGETWGMRFLTPHAPEQAERLWQVLRHEFIGVKPDGRLDFKLLPLGWDTRKPANFSSAQWPDLYPLMMTLWSALEMGDEEIIAATRLTMDERYGAGVADSQTWTGRNTVRDMVNKGLPEAWRKGPLLAEATYPEVIVTRAVSDGAALDLVLRAGNEPCKTKLGFGRLTPGASYRVVQTGETVKAGLDGTASLDFNLDKRSELRLVPA